MPSRRRAAPRLHDGAFGASVRSLRSFWEFILLGAGGWLAATQSILWSTSDQIETATVSQMAEKHTQVQVGAENQRTAALQVEVQSAKRKAEEDARARVDAERERTAALQESADRAKRKPEEEAAAREKAEAEQRRVL